MLYFKLPLDTLRVTFSHSPIALCSVSASFEALTAVFDDSSCLECDAVAVGHLLRRFEGTFALIFVGRYILSLISGCRRDVDEICALLGHYAASSGNPLLTFRDNLSVPSFKGQDFLALEGWDQ